MTKGCRWGFQSPLIPSSDVWLSCPKGCTLDSVRQASPASAYQLRKALKTGLVDSQDNTTGTPALRTAGPIEPDVTECFWTSCCFGAGGKGRSEVDWVPRGMLLCEHRHQKLLPEPLEKSKLPPWLHPSTSVWMVLVVRLPKKAVFKWVFCGQARLRSLGSYQACGSEHSLDAAGAISMLLHPHFCLVIRTLLVPPSLSPLLLRFAHLVGFLTTFLFLLIQHPVFASLPTTKIYIHPYLWGTSSVGSRQTRVWAL